MVVLAARWLAAGHPRHRLHRTPRPPRPV